MEEFHAFLKVYWKIPKLIRVSERLYELKTDEATRMKCVVEEVLTQVSKKSITPEKAELFAEEVGQLISTCDFSSEKLEAIRSKYDVVC